MLGICGNGEVIKLLIILEKSFPLVGEGESDHILHACQWMAYNHTCTHPHPPVFIYTCYHCMCKNLFDKLIACQCFSKCAQLSFCE